MTGGIHHLQFNVAPANLAFYRSLMTHLGWIVVYDDHDMLGCAATDSPQSVWFAPAASDVRGDRDGLGFNHIAFAAGSTIEVDAAGEWLRARGVETEFETPRHRPEFSRNEQETYYQVMFTSPDGILVEIVYTGPK